MCRHFKKYWKGPISPPMNLSVLSTIFRKMVCLARMEVTSTASIYIVSFYAKWSLTDFFKISSLLYEKSASTWNEIPLIFDSISRCRPFCSITNIVNLVVYYRHFLLRASSRKSCICTSGNVCLYAGCSLLPLTNN